MSEKNEVLDQMIADIFQQALRLDEVRLRFFLNWLYSHSSTVQSKGIRRQARAQMDSAMLQRRDLETVFKSGLKTWLESFPMQGLLWEYRLILDEIAWWHSLDGCRLAMISASEMGN